MAYPGENTDPFGANKLIEVRCKDCGGHYQVYASEYSYVYGWRCDRCKSKSK